MYGMTPRACSANVGIMKKYRVHGFTFSNLTPVTRTVNTTEENAIRFVYLGNRISIFCANL